MYKTIQRTYRDDRIINIFKSLYVKKCKVVYLLDLNSNKYTVNKSDIITLYKQPNLFIENLEPYE